MLLASIVLEIPHNFLSKHCQKSSMSSTSSDYEISQVLTFKTFRTYF
jgi:hypothetical protein